MSKPHFIVARASTMTYEISKHLSVVQDETKTVADVEARSHLLKEDGKCEYCEHNEGTTKDHFFPLVKHSLPTEYCNDFWNLVPCCTSCNSSKGNRDFWQWFDGTTKKNPFHKMNSIDKNRIRTKFEAYDKAFQMRHYKKRYPTDLVSHLNKKIMKFLVELEAEVELIQQSTTYHRSDVTNDEPVPTPEAD